MSMQQGSAKADVPTAASYEAAARLLNCEVAAIQAVGKVECGSAGAFLDTGEPTILFEPHVFDELTKGTFRGRRAIGIAGEAGVLSRARWAPGTYGPNSIQHKRLAAACALDREAALKSASWGLFQILGRNHKRAGHATVQEMVNAAYRSADDHLMMLVHFIVSDARLLDAIRGLDWVTFARLYNGAGYKQNRYDEKLETAFASLKEHAGVR